MIPDIVNPVLVPNDTLSAWAQTAQASLTALLQTPNINLGHLEELLENQARKLMLPILNAAAHVLAAQQPFRFPVCQEPLHAEAKERLRGVDSVFGSFGLKRAYGWCPACHSYWHPADPPLGLQPQAPASPRVQEIAALMSIRSPFAQAAQDAQRLTGLSLGPSFLHREAQRQGQRAIQIRQRDVVLSHTPQGVAELSARSATANRGPFT